MGDSPAEAAGWERTAKDLFAGALGGVAQVLLGQPFDIVKVRLQTTTQYKGAFDAATQILKIEGPLAFYKGTLTPLVGIGACVSVQFSAFHSARRYFSDLNGPTHPNLSSPQYFASGAFAGIANSALSGPIEHVRIRLQTQPHSPPHRLYTGPLDCVRKISAHSGLLHGLFRGQTVTVAREAVAYGTWFLTFEYLMNADARRNGIERKEVGTGRVAFYGGVAGEALWVSSYPLDVVKSKMQSDGFGEKARYRGVWDCVGQTWRGEGVRGFWRGLGPTLVRAMPVSAGTFAVVEAVLRALG